MDPADPEVAAVVQELLTGPVGAAFAELCGPDAVLRECSAVVSAPGSPPQPCHSDTKWTEDLVLATCFVALQDIGPELGPTRFLPDTATADAHGALADAPRGARRRRRRRFVRGDGLAARGARRGRRDALRVAFAARGHAEIYGEIGTGSSSTWSFRPRAGGRADEHRPGRTARRGIGGLGDFR